jgi:hypothetical protein
LEWHEAEKRKAVQAFAGKVKAIETKLANGGTSTLGEGWGTEVDELLAGEEYNGKK